MITFLFPGQGAQAKGMGATLFDEFADYTRIADEILGYSIKQLCLEDPKQQLNSTQFTQPALFVVSALSFMKKIRNGIKPDYVAGHSLGEYNALFAADVVDFATGLQLVQKRGALMSLAEGGGMAAIVGVQADKIEEFLKQNALDTITIANYNSYLQSVITGPKTDILHAQERFQQSKIGSFIPLKVSGAFHSSYMQQAQIEFTEYLKKFTFRIPTTPVIANVNASMYHPAVTLENLTKQMTSSVLWTKTIEILASKGSMQFEEVGQGSILSGLLLKIQNKQ